MEIALFQQAGELGAQEFHPRLDVFKTIATELASQQVSPSLLVNLGPTWIWGFPRHHPEPRTKFAVLWNYQRLHASHPTQFVTTLTNPCCPAKVQFPAIHV